MKNRLILSTLCFLCILGTLYWGLKPFNFNSANGVDWLIAERGIYFYDRGIVYGSTELNNSDQRPLLGKNESISIELWLTPEEDDRRGFSYLFCLYNRQQQELFSLSQVKNFLNISKYQKPDKKGVDYKWKWLGNVFTREEQRLLTITSDKNKTTVYLDGKKIKKIRNYPLMSAREQTPAWRIILGNDPSGRKPWSGKIHGLALYNHSLSSKEVIEHFQKWRDDSAISLLKENGVIAFYPMDEQQGNLIHNVLNYRYNLLIPDRFIILKKRFLKLYRSNLTLNDTNLRDIRINILGFIPLGYLFFLAFKSYNRPQKTPTWRLILWGILGGLTVSLIIETLQVWLPTRLSSINDLIFNTFGTLLGIILAGLFIRFKTRFQRTSFSEPQ